jgi:Lrp/AsnC family leucine-responsive transcriptional regulator
VREEGPRQRPGSDHARRAVRDAKRAQLGAQLAGAGMTGADLGGSIRGGMGMRRLRASGAIEREVAIVRPKTLGWPLSMIVLVTLEREDPRTMDEMMAQLRAEPEVIEAWNVTGDFDVAVKMIARDMESYDDTVKRLFLVNERVRTFQTLVVIRQLKDGSAIPVAPD